MRKKIIQNNKGQFFIAAAVIMILAITAMFNYVTNVEDIDASNLIGTDPGFFFNNIKEEYGKVVELALSNASRGHLDAGACWLVLSENLSSFNNTIGNLSREKGMYLSAEVNPNSAPTNTSMNASIRLTLKTYNCEMISEFNVSREIHVTITNVAGGQCAVRVTVKKEFKDWVTGLNLDGASPNLLKFDVNRSTAVGLWDNDQDCKAGTTYVEFMIGTYDLLGPAGCDCTYGGITPFVERMVTIELLDHRNLSGIYDHYSN